MHTVSVTVVGVDGVVNPMTSKVFQGPGCVERAEEYFDECLKSENVDPEDRSIAVEDGSYEFNDGGSISLWHTNVDSNVQLMNASEVEKAGYAKFNDGDHLCVDVPDRRFTISCRADSQRITFSFASIMEGKPGCVDIHNHDSCVLGDGGRPLQTILALTEGNTAFAQRADGSQLHNEKAGDVSLVTLLLNQHHKHREFGV